jgi:hypothetical protein
MAVILIWRGCWAYNTPAYSRYALDGRETAAKSGTYPRIWSAQASATRRLAWYI